MNNFRIGYGYDSHRFEPGRRLVLGGVEFPGETGLKIGRASCRERV